MDAFGATVAENSVVYRGFIIPGRDRPSLTLDQITAYRNECLNAIGHRLAGYIWQEEPFSLNVVAKDETYGMLDLKIVLTLCLCVS